MTDQQFSLVDLQLSLLMLVTFLCPQFQNNTLYSTQSDLKRGGCIEL